MPDDPHEIVMSIVTRLVQAWNAADGPSWGAEFAEDAASVNVRDQSSRQSIIITRDGGTWRIAAIHNTLITPQL